MRFAPISNAAVSSAMQCHASPVYVGKDTTDLIGNITGNSNKNGDTLFFDVMGNNNRLLYMMPLTELYFPELNLDAGRFEFYSKFVQPHAVCIGWEYFSHRRHTFIQLFKEHLEWVAVQANDLWSFTLDVQSVSKTGITYSFANLTTAALFRLVWG